MSITRWSSITSCLGIVRERERERGLRGFDRERSAHTKPLLEILWCDDYQDSFHGVWNGDSTWKPPPTRKFHTKRVKGGVFNKSQRDFLLRLFNNGGPKIRERDAHNRMVTTFNDKNEDSDNSDFSLRLVLSETQIKSCFLSEAGRHKKAAVNRAMDSQSSVNQ